jgi:acyl carrier protein
MTEQEFLERMAEIFNLDVDGISMDCVLEAEPAYDSVAILSMIILMDELGRVVQGPAIRNCKTVADLWALAQA